MAEIGKVGAGIPTPQQQTRAGEQQPVPAQGAQTRPAHTQSPRPEATAARTGALGQPSGMPAPGVTAQTKIMPDALRGRDPSQVAAAEQMRATGGTSATDELLGLNHKPSMIGAFAPPPGNYEALRHMTPSMRRTIMRSLLDDQRERMRRLADMLRRERDGQREGEREQDRFADEFEQEWPEIEEAQLARARVELGHAVRMFRLLEELLTMQDYTFSQMSTFTQG